MKIDVFTLFPEWFDWFMGQRHVRNATTTGLAVDFVDMSATTPLRAGQVDDTPYGGGAGMVVRVDVVEAALAARYSGAGVAPTRILALAAGGRQFDEALATELAEEPAIVALRTCLCPMNQSNHSGKRVKTSIFTTHRARLRGRGTRCRPR